MTHSPRIPCVALALLVAACGGSGGTNGSPSTPGDNTPAGGTPALNRTVVLQGLSNPWDIAIAADGAMFFTEKCRGLSVRRADGTVTRLFGTSGSALVAPDLACVGQSGVHGVALDPAFATNRTLYVYMLSNLSTSPRTNRVVRLVVDAGYTSASNRTDIVTDIAFKDVGQRRRRRRLAQRRPHPIRARRIPLRHHGRQSQPRASAESDDARRQGAARDDERCRGAGQRSSGRLRRAHLHVRASQRAGHHVPSGNGPAVHLGARAESQRRSDGARERRERRLGSAGPADALVPRRLLRLRRQSRRRCR